MGRNKKPENAHLPKYVQQRRGRFYINYRDDDGNKRLRAAGKTMRDVRATFRLLGMDPDCLDPYVMPKQFPTYLWQRARLNAKSKNVPFSISKNDVEEMIKSTGGRCPISGVKFHFIKKEGERFRPWAPSIDRLDPQSGYVLGNCRIVCAYVNLAMNEFGEEIFFAIARYVGRRKPKSVSDMTETRPHSSDNSSYKSEEILDVSY